MLFKVNERDVVQRPRPIDVQVDIKVNVNTNVNTDVNTNVNSNINIKCRQNRNAFNVP